MVHPRQVKKDYHKEHHRKPSGKDEQVLRLESFELDGVAGTFVYRIFHRL